MREFLCAIIGLMAFSLSAETKECRWWFDSNPKTTNTTQLTSGSLKMELDASNLAPGFHTVYLMVTDEKGNQSGVVSQPFIMEEDQMDATAYISVDNDFREALKPQSRDGKFSANLDLRDLKNGLHTLQATVLNPAGTISMVMETAFLRVSTDDEIRSGTAYVCVDQVLRKEIKNATGDGIFATELDLSDLDNGLHTLQTFVKSADGSVSAVFEGVFIRVASGDEIAKMRCFYSIDNEEGALYDGKISGNLLYADIDATELEDGLHSISFMLIGENGETTQAYTSYFLKYPLGGVNLNNYSYWINDKVDKQVNVKIENASNPYLLTGLLPLEKQPFRSTSYQFNVEKGEPVVYAKNDFNLLLMDNRGYATLQSFPYYDSSSREVVTKKVTPFTSTVEQVKRVGSNEITWYSFEAQKGDSITFKLNTDCAFEIYAPDGRLLCQSTADKSRTIHGAHAPISGKHYVAMHDQLGSVNYFKAYLTLIDKFSILKNSPANIGPAGLIVFKFEGNGFDQLKSAELTGNGIKPIKSTAFDTADWSFGMAAFDLDANPITAGLYYLTLHFDDNGKDVVLKHPVAVNGVYKEAIQVSVAPHNTSVADIRDITVTLYNNSTVGYWGVPFCVARTSQDPDMMFDFKFLAADCKDKFEDPVYYDTDNLLGTGEKGRYVPMIIPYIGPKEKLTYNFRIPRVINNTFDFFAWCGEPWSEEYSRLGAGPAKSPGRALSAERQDRNYNTLVGIQNVASAVGDVTPDAVSRPLRTGNIAVSTGCAIAGVYGGLDARRKQAEREAYGAMYDEISDGLVHYRIPTGMTPIAILNNSGILPFNIPDPYAPHCQLAQQCQDNGEYGEGRSGRNRVQFPASYDPNDILGYLSPSGSHYIGKEVKSLNYTVEFENDPEFATASALSVKVANKLDSKVFELSSFKPKELKIGKKKLSFDETLGTQTATLDMRPEINGIAQVSLDYNQTTGQIFLTLETLDPYTMDVSDDLSQGILPVNANGSGLGEFTYEIDLKSGIAHNAKISNKASIVFDSNVAIETPAWENVTDFISPVSEILSVVTSDDQTYQFEFDGTDADAGIWQYELYMRSGGNTDWTLVKDAISDSTCTHTFDKPVVNPQFATVAIDHAGNREENEVRALLKGDVDSNGKVDANDLVLLYSYYIGRPVTIDLDVADMNNDGRVDSQDAVSIQRVYLGQVLKKGLKRKLKNFIR